jgi:hypothetical protein
MSNNQHIIIIIIINFAACYKVDGRSSAANVGSNPTWGMDVCLLCVGVLSGRGLCDELINRSGESYRLWRVVVWDHETSWTRKP